MTSTEISEDHLQYKISRWLDSHKILHFHPPNGGKRDRREAAKFVAMGVRKGVPDLVILLSDGITVFIELKVDAPLSKAQKSFHEKLKKVSHHIYTVKSLTAEDGIAQVSAILAEHGIELDHTCHP